MAKVKAEQEHDHALEVQSQHKEAWTVSHLFHENISRLLIIYFLVPSAGLVVLKMYGK